MNINMNKFHNDVVEIVARTLYATMVPAPELKDPLNIGMSYATASHINEYYESAWLKAYKFNPMFRRECDSMCAQLMNLVGNIEDYQYTDSRRL